MSAAAAAIAAAPPDAVELRIIRYRLRKPAGQAAGEWVGDAVSGGDGGPSDGPRPLRTAVVHWITASGGTVSFELPRDETFGPDDIARLLVEARRRDFRCAVWGALPRMLRENWERAMVGTGQQFTASLGAQQLSVEVVRNGRQQSLTSVDRIGLVALGTTFGFTAYTHQGAVDLPNTWATMQLTEQQRFAPAISAAINSVIGAA